MKKIIAALLSLIMSLCVFSGIYFNKVDAEAAVAGDIRLSANYLGLEVNQKRTLLAYVTPSEYADDIIWSTSDSSVADISSDGVVTAVSEGVAKITANVEKIGELATCQVHVLRGDLRGSFDFSEANMITNSTWEDTYPTPFISDDGGNTTMAVAYLSRWDGAVLEEKDRFPSSMNPDDLVYSEKEADYHLQNAVFIPDRRNYLDNSRIKEAIIRYGAIYATFAVNYNCFDYYFKTYYRPGYISPDSGGHAITIVGWDDEFSRYNFEYTPDGDGAFICKNSWGVSSGENGYFYISYYDASIGKRDIMTAYTGLELASNYNKIYQYDPYGPVDSLYASDEPSFYAANIYPENSQKLSSDEELSAVSFYTYSENTSYEIFVIPDYKYISQLSSDKMSVKSGVIENAGYYTINFDPVLLEAGSRFAVIVRLTLDNGEDSRFYAETPVDDYSEAARANSNESFFSFDGDLWTDLTDEFENSNFCLKAFTNVSDTYSGMVMSGIDNTNREYESDKVYSVDEIAARDNSDINPEFVEYINSLNSNMSKSKQDNSLRQSSIPSPIVISSSSDRKYSCSLPSYFNLADEGCLTSVKNQGDVNGCWTFATYASMESCLLRNASNLTSIPSGGNQTDEINAVIAASNVELTGITLTEIQKEVLVAEQFTLDAEASPVNAKMDKVIWSSSDPKIATVDSKGIVTADRPGTVTITAKAPDSEVSSSCIVTVKPRSFCITWDVDGKLYTQLVLEYSPIIPNITPQKTGHTFIGWSPVLPEFMPSENVAYSAQWSVNSYSTLFNAAGGRWNDSLSSKTVITDYNKKIVLPENPVRDGYDFAGWDKNIPSRMPAENLTFNATWTPRDDTKYTVNTYVMNTDGSYSVSGKILYGTTEKTVTASYDDVGKGMFINTSKSKLSGEILGDGSLVLSVYIDRSRYTFTTVSDGEETSAEYYCGQSINQPRTPFKKGYHFAGWTPEVPATMPAENVTVHAVFKKLYSLSIKNNPGRNTVNYGDTLVLTAVTDELPEGTDISWYIDGDGFEATVSDDGVNCYLTSTGSGSVKITAVITNEDGSFFLNPDGNIVADSQNVTSDAGFFRIIISFFKNLFGLNRYIIQNIF